MFVRGVGVATPEHRYTQRECWDALCSSSQLSLLSGRSQAILRRVLTADNGIRTRSFVMKELSEAFSLDANTLHRRFAENAPALACAAAENALRASRVDRQNIDGLLISTCTGYLCPGLTSYVSEKLGLRRTTYLADFVGQGCGAALPNWRAAQALLASNQAAHVLSVCVEVCSAAFYLDNDPGVLISACLFGDGAGAAVLSQTPGEERPIEWIDYATDLNPADRDLLRFETRDGMLRNVLDKSIPLLVVEQVREVLNALLSRNGVNMGDLRGWILHAGGRDVLAALESGLGLGKDDLRWSSEILAEFGNVSSPSVIFALQRALESRLEGGVWFMSSFGAGISSHGALLKAGEL